MKIKKFKKSREELEEMNVFSWPTWKKEKSEFDWEYAEKERCYLLEGKAVIEPKNSNEKITIEKGDFVEFPKGMKCKWKIVDDVKKHYSLG